MRGGALPLRASVRTAKPSDVNTLRDVLTQVESLTKRRLMSRNQAPPNPFTQSNYTRTRTSLVITKKHLWSVRLSFTNQELCYEYNDK